MFALSTVLYLSFVNVQWYQAIAFFPVVQSSEFVALQSLTPFPPPDRQRTSFETPLRIALFD